MFLQIVDIIWKKSHIMSHKKLLFLNINMQHYYITKTKSLGMG